MGIMTNIVEETQLDYSDVLIKPKRSTLNSRKESCIYREYKFKHSNKRIYGNGFTVVNMATTGTVIAIPDEEFVKLMNIKNSEELEELTEEVKEN